MTHNLPPSYLLSLSRPLIVSIFRCPISVHSPTLLPSIHDLSPYYFPLLLLIFFSFHLYPRVLESIKQSIHSSQSDSWVSSLILLHWVGGWDERGLYTTFLFSFFLDSATFFCFSPPSRRLHRRRSEGRRDAWGEGGEGRGKEGRGGGIWFRSRMKSEEK